MSDKKGTSGLNRREFLKGSILVAGGLAVGVSGCAPKGSANTVSGSNQATGKFSFETPPDPIKASEIKENKSADVVILGAGLSGLCAAYAAADAGAKVIVLEKRETFTYHGGWNGVLGDRQHKNQGVEVSQTEVMAELMRFGAYHPNQLLHLVWKNESGRVMDRLFDLADAAGIQYAVDTDNKDFWPYREFPIAINFLPGMNGMLLGLLEQNVKAKGVEILYETPAAQLIREENGGKVTGVYAKLEEGYLQVDAAKAVIICTGGYGSNKEMLGAYAPRALKTINNQYAELSNTGDGILMGMWIGGVKQETSCPMLWDGMIPGNEIFVSISRQPWLYVNTNGVRYANEDAPFGYTANQDIQQPGSEKWVIWDANWETDKDKFHGTICENMKPPLWTEESYASYMKRGVIIEANSLDELADMMKVPKETFLATVTRYNELVAKGVDEDFGKDPAKLTAIVKAPFGACKVGTGILVTTDGLRIDTEMRVLDADGKPISGLFAAGNASGDFFANDYPITVAGVSHGRALTFGWLAGEHASKA